MPQAVLLQDGAPLEGPAQATQEDAPQLCTLSFEAHCPVQTCAPGLHELSTHAPRGPSQAPLPKVNALVQSEQAAPQQRSLFATHSAPLECCPVGQMQTPVAHWPVAQSPPILQCLPREQRAGHEPPQSTSVSVPFWSPSEQLEATQRPSVQMPPRQSEATLQGPPLTHLATQVPPQSIPDSVPLRRPSSQVGTLQVPRTQARPDWQGLLVSSQIWSGGAPQAASSTAATQKLEHRVRMVTPAGS